MILRNPHIWHPSPPQLLHTGPRDCRAAMIIMTRPDKQPSTSSSALAPSGPLFVPIESLSNSPMSSTGSASVLEWNSNSDSDQFHLASPLSPPVLTAPSSPQQLLQSTVAHSPPRVSEASAPAFDEPFAIDWNDISFQEDFVSPSALMRQASNTVTTVATPTAVDDASEAPSAELESAESATVELIKRMSLEDIVNKWKADAHDAAVADGSSVGGRSYPSSSPTETHDTSSSTILAPPSNEAAPLTTSYRPLSFTLSDEDGLAAGISIAEYFHRKAVDASDEATSLHSSAPITSEPEIQRPASSNSALSYCSRPSAQQSTASLTSQDADGSEDNDLAPEVTLVTVPQSSRSSSQSQSVVSESNDSYQQEPSSGRTISLNVFRRSPASRPYVESVSSTDIEFAAPPSPIPFHRAVRLSGASIKWGKSGPNRAPRLSAPQKDSAVPSHRRESLPSIPSWLSPPESEFRDAFQGDQHVESTVPFIGGSVFNLHPWLNTYKEAKVFGSSANPSADPAATIPPAPPAPRQRPPLPPLPSLKVQTAPTPQFALRDELLKPTEHVGTPFAQAFPSRWNAKSPSTVTTPSPRSCRVPLPGPSCHYPLYGCHGGVYNAASPVSRDSWAAVFSPPGQARWPSPPASPMSRSAANQTSGHDAFPSLVLPPTPNPYCNTSDHRFGGPPTPVFGPPTPVFKPTTPCFESVYDYLNQGSSNNACNSNSVHNSTAGVNSNRVPYCGGGYTQTGNPSWYRKVDRSRPQQQQPRWVRFAPTPSPPPIEPFSWQVPTIPQIPPMPQPSAPVPPVPVPPPELPPVQPPVQPSYLAELWNINNNPSFAYSSPAPVIPPMMPATDASAGWYTTSRKYAFGDATVIFRVETYLFKVHRHFFERHSEFFRKLLSTYWFSHSNHVFLQDVKKAEFERLLSVFYPMDLTKPDIPNLKGWLSLLTLSQKWEMPQVKQLCIQHIGTLAWPMEKVIIAHKYGLRHPGPAWLFPAYKAVCARSVPLPLHEAAQLDMETVIKIWEVHHEVGNMRLRGESADETEKRVEELVKEKFGHFEPAEGEVPVERPITGWQL